MGHDRDEHDRADRQEVGTVTLRGDTEDVMGVGEWQPQHLWSRHWSIITPCLATVVFVAFVQLTHPLLPTVHDAYAFTVAAQQLVADGSFSYGVSQTLPAAPNAASTPGYPLLLVPLYALADRGAGIVDWARAVRPMLYVVQALMAVGLVGVLAQCGRMLGGPRLALMVGLMAAVYPPYALATLTPLSDLFGSLLVVIQLMVALMVTDKKRPLTMGPLGVLGVLSGLIALVRPAYFLWAAAPLLYVALTRRLSVARVLTGVGVFGVTFLLVMAPWWVRNAVTFDKFIALNTNSGLTMLDALGGRELTAEEKSIERFAEIQGKDGASAVAWRRIGVAWKSSPLDYAMYRAQRAWYVVLIPWSALRDAYWEHQYDYDEVRIDYAELPDAPNAIARGVDTFALRYHRLLLLLALVGLALVPKSPRLLLAASLPVYSVLMHSWTMYIDRYFLPAMAGVLLLAAAGAIGAYLSITRALRGTTSAE